VNTDTAGGTGSPDGNNPLVLLNADIQGDGADGESSSNSNPKASTDGSLEDQVKLLQAKVKESESLKGEIETLTKRMRDQQEFIDRQSEEVGKARQMQRDAVFTQKNAEVFTRYLRDSENPMEVLGAVAAVVDETLKLERNLEAEQIKAFNAAKRSDKGYSDITWDQVRHTAILEGIPFEPTKSSMDRIMKRIVTDKTSAIDMDAVIKKAQKEGEERIRKEYAAKGMRLDTQTDPNRPDPNGNDDDSFIKRLVGHVGIATHRGR